MYVGFRYHHISYPHDIIRILSLNPTKIISETNGHQFTQRDWSVENMRMFIEQGHWIPEEPLTTVILKALKNAL